MATDSRERMVRSAAYLFRERGYSGTGFRDVIAHSGAPRGSIYHHFPGGKVQLAQEAVRYAGEFLNAGIEAAVEGGVQLGSVDVLFALWM
jgi:AcrR family transcriptional regulator